MNQAVAFIADPHIGNFKQWPGKTVGGLNERCRHSLEAFRRALKITKEHGATPIVLGDLFHTEKPEPQVIAATQDVIHEQQLPHVLVMKGNHDSVSDEKGDHALGPLRCVAEIVDQPNVFRRGHTVAAAPFRRGNPKEWLPGVLETLRSESQLLWNAGGDRILTLHAGIWGDDFPAHLKAADASIHFRDLIKICQRFEIKYAFAGHWHWTEQFFLSEKEIKSPKDDVMVVQVGTICPSRFSDADGQMVILGGEEKPTITAVEVPGPLFFTVNSLEDLGKIAGNPTECPVYVKAEVSLEELNPARERLRAMEKEALIRGWTAMANRKAAETARQEAVKAVRSRPALEALPEYVAKRAAAGDLPEGIKSEEVVKRAQGYIEKHAEVPE
jgi:hypothetical protein